MQQLEKVGNAIDQPQHVPRHQVILPDDAPPNPMAPTPRRVRKPSQKPKVVVLHELIVRVLKRLNRTRLGLKRQPVKA